MPSPITTPHLSDRPRVARVADFLRELAAEFKADRVTGLAAEVAYFGILALFPALLAMAAALGQLESIVGARAAERTREAVIDGVADVLGTTDSGVIDVVESLFETESPGLFTFGLLAALFTVSRGMAAVVKALDVVYDLPESRSAVRLRLLAVGLSLGTVLVSAVMVTLLVVGPLFGQGEEIADRVGLGGVFTFLWDITRVPFAFAALVVWAAMLFHIGPDHRTPWRYDIPGALTAAVGWVGIAFGFRFYLQIAGSGNEVYGAIGGAIGLLLLLYLVGIVLMLGGEVNAIIAQRAGLSPGGGALLRPGDDDLPSLRELLRRR